MKLLSNTILLPSVQEEQKKKNEVDIILVDLITISLEKNK